jgi:hypothetical protein
VYRSAVGGWRSIDSMERTPEDLSSESLHQLKEP